MEDGYKVVVGGERGARRNFLKEGGKVAMLEEGRRWRHFLLIFLPQLPDGRRRI
jgi:hypothetical protein